MNNTELYRKLKYISFLKNNCFSSILMFGRFLEFIYYVDVFPTAILLLIFLDM